MYQRQRSACKVLRQPRIQTVWGVGFKPLTPQLFDITCRPVLHVMARGVGPILCLGKVKCRRLSDSSYSYNNALSIFRVLYRFASWEFSFINVLVDPQKHVFRSVVRPVSLDRKAPRLTCDM